MKQHSTIKLRELIKNLQEVLASEGNIPVAMSKDSEGNSYNTLSADDLIGDCIAIERGICVLYPWAECEDVEEIKGALITDEEEEEEEEDDSYDDDPPYGCNFEDEE